MIDRAVVFAKVDANKNGKVDASEVANLVLIMIEGADFSKLTSRLVCYCLCCCFHSYLHCC